MVFKSVKKKNLRKKDMKDFCQLEFNIASQIKAVTSTLQLVKE